jgi:hypothetical protein
MVDFAYLKLLNCFKFGLLGKPIYTAVGPFKQILPSISRLVLGIMLHGHLGYK